MTTYSVTINRNTVAKAVAFVGFVAVWFAFMLWVQGWTSGWTDYGSYGMVSEWTKFYYQLGITGTFTIVAAVFWVAEWE